MTTLLGYTIANDGDTIKQRQDSPLGYAKQDEPALIEFGILMRSKDNAIVRNANLGITSDQIRDFLNWVVGKREPPLPDLVRKILCLKRARITNSVESTGTSEALRTKENQMIAEIDTLLFDDGVKNPEDPTKCVSQSAGKYDSNKGREEAMANIKPASTTTTTGPTTGPGCSTIVNCDSSAVMLELKRIQDSLASLQTVLPKSATGPATTIDGIGKDMAALKEMVEEKQQQSEIVDKSNKAINCASKGQYDELLKILLEIQKDIKDGKISPIAAEAAAANIGMIKTKTLPKNTKETVDNIIGKLNSKANTITQPIIALRIQLDGLADIIKNQPAKIEEEVKNLLPKIKEQYTDVAIQIENELREEFKKIKDRIDESTLNVKSNIAKISPATDYTERFDSIDKAIKEISIPAGQDYEPQFKHLDDSVRTMYEAIQKIVADDYANRFNELNKKVDYLTDLMGKCCGAGPTEESTERPSLQINNNNNNKGTITPIEESNERPSLQINNNNNNKGTITPIEKKPSPKAKRVVYANTNFPIEGKQLPEQKPSSRRLFDFVPQKAKHDASVAVDYEDEKKPTKRRALENSNLYSVVEDDDKKKLEKEQSTRRVFGEGPKQVKHDPSLAVEYENTKPAATKPIVFSNNNFSKASFEPTPDIDTITEEEDKQDFGPVRPRRKTGSTIGSTNSEDEELRKLILGEDARDRSLKDLKKGLKNAIILEKPLNQDLKINDKVEQLKELQAAYQDEKEYEVIKKLTDEFLADFTDEGPLKRVLPKDMTLTEDNMAIYIKTLFDAIEGFEKPKAGNTWRKLTTGVQAAEAFKTTKKNKGSERKSKRTTRKLRR